MEKIKYLPASEEKDEKMIISKYEYYKPDNVIVKMVMALVKHFK